MDTLGPIILFVLFGPMIAMCALAATWTCIKFAKDIREELGW